MHRFFLPELQPQEGEVVSLREIHNQLFRVLRVQPGEQLLILDNAGSERLLEIASVERRDTTARVLKVRNAPAEPAVAVTLYQCMLRAEKFDLVLQKATELGVTTIVPVVSSRTLTRMVAKSTPKQARWHAIVREASEQCGRGGIPTVETPCTFAEAVARATGIRLLPWEEANTSRGFLTALGQSAQDADEISILIGPEGGLEADEVKQASAAGWQVVSLGKRILRAETAAITALSIVALAAGELGDAALARVQPAGDAKPRAKAANPESIASLHIATHSKSEHADAADAGTSQQEATQESSPSAGDETTPAASNKAAQATASLPAQAEASAPAAPKRRAAARSKAATTRAKGKPTTRKNATEQGTAPKRRRTPKRSESAS